MPNSSYGSFTWRSFDWFDSFADISKIKVDDAFIESLDPGWKMSKQNCQDTLSHSSHSSNAQVSSISAGSSSTNANSDSSMQNQAQSIEIMNDTLPEVECLSDSSDDVVIVENEETSEKQNNCVEFAAPQTAHLKNTAPSSNQNQRSSTLGIGHRLVPFSGRSISRIPSLIPFNRMMNASVKRLSPTATRHQMPMLKHRLLSGLLNNSSPQKDDSSKRGVTTESTPMETIDLSGPD